MELQNVSKAYGGKPVLSRFSAVLAPGGRYALMGPSGVGKTTLLLLLQLLVLQLLLQILHIFLLFL